MRMLCGLVFFLVVCACSSADAGETTLSATQLQEDLEILGEAVMGLHPGLFRYQSQKEIDDHFAHLQQELSRDRTLREAYLAFSRFAVVLQCGHTYCNYWNQPESVRNELFLGADKLPFTFSLIGRRMVVTRDATDDHSVPPGTEVIAIDGRGVDAVLETLLQYVKSDGSNEAVRLHDLQVSGEGEYESFDIYYPLLFPPDDGRVRVLVQDAGQETSREIELTCTTRDARAERLLERYSNFSTSVDELWRFEMLSDQVAYLKLGSFVTWKMKMEWKTFLENAFKTIADRGAKDLIIDIRGNAGGADEVNLELTRYVVTKEVQIESWQQRLRYERVSDELSPYLDTWDDSFRDRRGQVEPEEEGFYRPKYQDDESMTLFPQHTATQAQITLLVDAANSSATFFLARIMKEGGLATLVGETTGGNLRGTNGGQLFFLRLPNSGIEMDLPLIGYYPRSEQPDDGLVPDVVVERTVEDVRAGVDAILETALRRIATGSVSRDE